MTLGDGAVWSKGSKQNVIFDRLSQTGQVKEETERISISSGRSAALYWCCGARTPRLLKSGDPTIALSTQILISTEIFTPG